MASGLLGAGQKRRDDVPSAATSGIDWIHRAGLICLTPGPDSCSMRFSLAFGIYP